MPVLAPAGSRLEDLLARYEPLKAAAEEAASRFKDLTDAIKAEVTSANPGVTSLALGAGPGMPVLLLTWVEQWRVDSKRLKEESPVTYVRYAKKSGRWELRAQ